MRLYVTDESFPELREVASRWQRFFIWLRAFKSACLDWRLFALFGVLVIVTSALLIAGLYLADGLPRSAWGSAARLCIFSLPALIVIFTLSTFGGELMRPHLRKVSESCRLACPTCGQSLRTQLESPAPLIRCPECGCETDRRPFTPPYRT